MKRYVLADPHGGYKALLQVLERSGFNREEDELIVLGDICDGWPETRQCIDELLKIKNLNYIIGNHDKWTLDWFVMGLKPDLWVSQGGYNTMRSYDYNRAEVPESHIEFLKNASWYIETDGCLFVHGGIEPYTPMNKQDIKTIMWDRKLIQDAYYTQKIADGKKLVAPNLTGYREVFVGHTTTLLFQQIEPVKYCEIWDLDTGGGWHGKLTIMDRDTHEYWQSDYVQDLYPGSHGRNDY